jgi:hypothetical protein
MPGYSADSAPHDSSLTLSKCKEARVDRRRFFVAAAAASAAFAPKLAQAQDSDAEFQQYVGSATAVLGMMGWFFDEMTRLTTNVTDADFVNRNWHIDVLGPFTIAAAAQQYLGTITPPSLMEESHGYLVDSIDNIVIAGDQMRDGVLNQDVSSINLAAESMARANELINQANDAMPFTP